ncbi:Atu4866 domain-containing protein [Lonsdalea quercina]|uniref:Atu4866 domain-containing protein n=1 Tax=Lonsdalea quercina TaxID=71657 RepID=UPI0039752D2A
MKTVTVLALFGLIITLITPAIGQTNPMMIENAVGQKEREMQHAYIGMWVTSDGHIRQMLQPNGRYDEARGNRLSAYQGRYEIKGNRIDYWDDTGFTAYGTFVNDDELYHGGMIFYREKG